MEIKNQQRNRDEILKVLDEDSDGKKRSVIRLVTLKTFLSNCKISMPETLNKDKVKTQTSVTRFITPSSSPAKVTREEATINKDQNAN